MPRTTILGALSVLLLSGSLAQTSTASERHIHNWQPAVSQQLRNANALALPQGVANPTAPPTVVHPKYNYRDDPDLSVQDAAHFGYGSGRCGYHSGYGGLYGDGYYPDGVCEDGGSHLID